MSACESGGEAEVSPPGQASLPSASGALSFVEMRGDDRLAIGGRSAATWSHDGHEVITATHEGVQFWSASTGVLERSLSFGRAFRRVIGIKASPDGRWLAVGGEEQADQSEGESSRPHGWGVRLVDLQNAMSVQVLSNTGRLIAFNAESTELVCEQLRRDLAAGTETPVAEVDEDTLSIPGSELVVTFTPVGPRRQSFRVFLRSTRHGEVLHDFGLVRFPSMVAVSGDGNRVAIVNDALTVYQIEGLVHQAEELATVLQVPNPEAASVALSHDGARVVVNGGLCVQLDTSGDSAVSCADPMLSIFNVDDGSQLWSRPSEGSAWHFSRDGRFLTGADTRLVTSVIRVEDGEALNFNDRRIWGISSDGNWALVARTGGYTIESLQQLPPRWNDRSRPRTLALASDGMRAVREEDGSLNLIRGESCLRIGSVEALGAHLRLAADGSTLIAVLRNPDTLAIRGFDLDSGALRWTLQVGGEGDAVGVSNRQVLIHGRDHAEFSRFDVRDGTRLPDIQLPRLSYHGRLADHSVRVIRDTDGERVTFMGYSTLSHDGRSIANCEFFDQRYWVSVWDLNTPREVVDLPAQGLPNGLLSSPQDATWAIGYRNGAIRWITRGADHLVDGAESHGARVTAMAFSPSGDTMVSAGEDGSLLVFVVATGEVLGRAELPLDHATHLAITADGAQVRVETSRGMAIRFGLATR